ncbi:CBS domain-containing protein [Microbispora sp. KK1-11]|uniref:CBS domain-containing protein n=1 Tax=Microbispora sp. KK1-11 TaxID=2053005 RepID=UPI00163BD3DE|nr:CBS domain-containing protein [Microbispora sp. KK1-11]
MNGDGSIVLRIGHLPTARLSKLVSVCPDDTLTRAETLLTRYKYSQLPVLADRASLIGAVTLESIALVRIAGQELTLASATRPVQEVSVDAEVRKVLPLLRQHRFAIVRDESGMISGIVTLADLVDAMEDRTGPHAILGEIERRLRKILEQACPTVEDLQAATGKTGIRSVRDLTLFDVEQVFGRANVWTGLHWRLDQSIFVAELRAVRKIRNKFAHYHDDEPRPLPEPELAQLTGFLDWLAELAPQR